MSKTPHLSVVGIRAFECAARCQSFTKAAKELCITQSAVSKQIKALEDRLGFTLLNRLPRKLVLTKEGKLLFDAAHTALSTIQTAVEEIKKDLPSQKIVLSAPESLSIKWLIPRMKGFFDAYQNLDLFVEADNKYVDLSEKKVDLVIRYGNGNYPGHYVKLLMNEFLVPVCSPEYMKNHAIKMSELNQYCLLDDRHLRKWDIWLKANNFKQSSMQQDTKNKRLSFSRDDLMIEAARSGQGIAMGLWSFVKDDIAENRLVELFNNRVKTEKQYYIVCLKETALRQDTKSVIDWLLTISQK